MANMQNRNVKLFTIITVFFLPLGFVTSVFGMQNMPQSAPFDNFAVTLVAICIPTYLIMIAIWPTNPMQRWKKRFETYAPDCVLRLVWRAAYEQRIAKGTLLSLGMRLPGMGAATSIFRRRTRRTGTMDDIKVWRPFRCRSLDNLMHGTPG